MADAFAPCPTCGTSSQWIGVTPEPDEREYYFDIHWCPACCTEFEDADHPMIYDYDLESFEEVKDIQPPILSRAQMEAAGQLRLFEEAGR